MVFFRVLVTINLILFVILIGHEKFVVAQSNLLKTESIRKKLYERMDERKKSKTLNKVSEKTFSGILSQNW